MAGLPWPLFWPKELAAIVNREIVPEPKKIGFAICEAFGIYSIIEKAIIFNNIVNNECFYNDCPCT